MVKKNHARYVKVDPNVAQEVIRLYTSGINRLPIAKRFGFGRRLVDRILAEHDVPLRSAAETNRLIVSRRSPEENRRNTEAAHAAVRGVRRTVEELRQRALRNEIRARSQEPLSQLEGQFLKLARKLSLDVIPQKAVETYNLDFLVKGTPIAVEILSAGGYRIQAPEFAREFNERAKDLLNRGYCLVMIWATDCLTSKRRWGATSIERGCVNEVITLTEILRLNPASLRQQYVVLGDGEPTTLGGDHFDYSACERPFHNGKGVG